MRARSISLSLARVQLVVVIGVILGFFITTGVAAVRSQHLDEDVDQIVGDAMPSVQHLSAARSALHELDLAVQRYVSAARAGGHPSGDSVERERQSVDAAIDTYANLPRFPNESTLAASVTSAEADVDGRIDATMAAVSRNDWAAAQAELSVERRDAERADAAIARLVQFNAEQGRKLGLETLAWRRSTLETAVALDTLVALLALAAAVLATLNLRRAVADIEAATDVAEKRASMSEERSTELEQFAGRVAHDVLSPLMAVGIGLQLAKAKLKGDPSAATLIDRSTGSLMRVRRIVEGLLQFARAGARPRGDESADLHEAVLGVIDDVRGEAEQLGIEIVVEPFEGDQLACSPGVLSSLVGNLVRNAVKYMGEAPVRRIVLRAVDGGPRVRFEVEDTGPGVAPEMHASIFEPFVRAASPTIPGAGLGLATVKKLAQAHGGHVGCRSEPGKGSLFWFELPAAPPPSERGVADAPPSPAPPHAIH